ncbi:MAG: hypothetical protein KGQ49_00460 [Verrucomicrobia bacterium]|nr:hypothetical protein [Verrucomicrobiota bacterium]MBU6445852.1 hypothetical protein [Verrucomicrobiota bacterium]
MRIPDFSSKRVLRGDVPRELVEDADLVKTLGRTWIPRSTLTGTPRSLKGRVTRSPIGGPADLASRPVFNKATRAGGHAGKKPRGKK